jgi:hypothetical protein
MRRIASGMLDPDCHLLEQHYAQDFGYFAYWFEKLRVDKNITALRRKIFLEIEAEIRLGS